MPRPIRFEVHADDPNRAMRFYGDLFGWRFEYYMNDYWSVVTGDEGTPGINGGLVRRRGERPAVGAPSPRSSARLTWPPWTRRSSA